MASRTRAKDTKTRSGTVRNTPPPSRKRGPSNAGEQQNKRQRKHQGDPQVQEEDEAQQGDEEEPKEVKKAARKPARKPRAKKERYAPSPLPQLPPPY